MTGSRRRAFEPRRANTITVSQGIGVGLTKLAAFDAALLGAGVANFNLLLLSSVIPSGTDVVRMDKGSAGAAGEWGDRLYVVLADMRVDEAGEQAWAGLGWIQDPGSGRGLFVEHHAHTEAAVRLSIEASLTSMAATRGEEFGPPRYAVQGAVCRHEPVCALVVAVYQSASWSDQTITLS